MRFMILVRATEQSEAGAKPDEAVFKAMADYHEHLMKAGVLLDGNGLQPSAKGWRIRYDGDKRTVIDGPFAEAKEMIGGFYLLACDNKAQALEIARECPAAEWASVEVRALAPCYET